MAEPEALAADESTTGDWLGSMSDDDRAVLGLVLDEARRRVLDDWEPQAPFGHAPGRDGPRRSITCADIERIYTTDDDGIRNHLITLGYWDLARIMLGYTHPPWSPPDGGAPPDIDQHGDQGAALIGAAVTHHRGTDPGAGRPLNANFCTYGTWSSLTIRTNLRNHLAPRRLDELAPDVLRGTITTLAIDARRTNDQRLSRLLALGQKVVFREVGWGLCVLLEKTPELDACVGDRLAHRRAACSGTGHDLTTTLLEACAELEPEVREHICEYDLQLSHSEGLDDPRWEELRHGLVSYYFARRLGPYGDVGLGQDGDPDLDEARAQLVLRGNLLIGSYEQRRVQQVLDYPVDEFPGDFFGERVGIGASEQRGAGRWRRRFNRNLLGGFDRWVHDVWARALTDQILVVRLGDEIVRLGRDIPDPASGTSFLPDHLVEVKDQWLGQLILRYDHSFGNGHGTAAHNWGVFDDRMNFIANLFRSRAQEIGLWTSPFTLREERIVRSARDPYEHRYPGESWMH